MFGSTFPIHLLSGDWFSGAKFPTSPLSPLTELKILSSWVWQVEAKLVVSQRRATWHILCVLFLTYPMYIWLVVSTHLKNISQNWNLPQIGVKIKNIWNHHLVYIYPRTQVTSFDIRPCWNLTATVWGEQHSLTPKRIGMSVEVVEFVADFWDVHHALADIE